MCVTTSEKSKSKGDLQDLGNDRVLEAEGLTKQWLIRFQSLGLDGFFYSADYDLFSATNYLKEINWTPTFAIAGDLRFFYYGRRYFINRGNSI